MGVSTSTAATGVAMDILMIGLSPRGLKDIGRLLTVDPIEGTMLREVGGLRTGPAAEDGVDGHQLRNLRESVCVQGENRRIARAIIMLRRYFLALFGIKIPQVFLSHLAGAMQVDVLVHHADRRLRDNAERGCDDVELGGTQLLDGEKGFAFPCEQHVSNAP